MKTNTTHHVLNNRQWLHFMESSTFQEKPFSAIILTGWSRFDHFMPLCDLFPTAYPSLLYSLYVLNTDKILNEDSLQNCDNLMKSIDKDRQLCDLLPGNMIRTKGEKLIRGFC
jgi:hexosaminidase